MDRIFHSRIILNFILLMVTVNLLTISASSLRHTVRQQISRRREQQLERDNELEITATDILNSLGLSDIPQRHQIPEFASQLFQTDATEEDATIVEEEHFMRESARVLKVAEPGTASNGENTLKFTIDGDDTSMHMQEVKLYFHIYPSNELSNDTHQHSSPSLNFKLTMLRENQEGEMIADVVNSIIIIDRDLIGWHSQKIPSHMVNQVTESLEEEEPLVLEFILECLNCDDRFVTANTSDANLPFLTINGNRRSRRSEIECQGSCCKRELIVDFDALGWDFILSPRQYTANYCHGSCRNADLDDAALSTNTDVINAMLRQLRKAATATCCTPRDTTPITVVYFNMEGALISSVNTLKTIDSCSCH